jgi:hypothetical protein
VEAHQAKTAGGAGGVMKYAGDALQGNQKLIEMEKKLIEDNLEKMRTADDK